MVIGEIAHAIEQKTGSRLAEQKAGPACEASEASRTKSRLRL